MKHARILGACASLFFLPAAMCSTTGDGSGIPAERLVCPDEPDRPVGEGPGGEITDEQNGTYLRGLRGAYLGCKEDVDWIRDYVKKGGN